MAAGGVGAVPLMILMMTMMMMMMTTTTTTTATITNLRIFSSSLREDVMNCLSSYDGIPGTPPPPREDRISCELKIRAYRSARLLPYHYQRRLCETNEWDDDKVKDIILQDWIYDLDTSSADEILNGRSCSDFLPPLRFT